MSHGQKAKMDDLIRDSICDIVRSDEVQHLIDDSFFISVDDHRGIPKDGSDIFPHICISQCKAWVGNNGSSDNFQCRKKNNLKISHDNTEHFYVSLPNEYTPECMLTLAKIEMIRHINL